MLAGWLSDDLYVIGSIANMNGDPTDPFDHVESFFDESELFSSVELGWTSSQDRFYTDNVHLTFWHVDSVDSAGTPSGWGVNFSAAKWINDAYMPFLRAGYADDGGSLLEVSVSVGVATEILEEQALAGVAGNWGEPNGDTFGAGLDDQFGIEAFLR
ncbi:MAG: porin, partial [Akkermansiaceae bacterium]|nr:porin [Akkermansiaceae bacterium]